MSQFVLQITDAFSIHHLINSIIIIIAINNSIGYNVSLSTYTCTCIYSGSVHNCTIVGKGHFKGSTHRDDSRNESHNGSEIPEGQNQLNEAVNYFFIYINTLCCDKCIMYMYIMNQLNIHNMKRCAVSLSLVLQRAMEYQSLVQIH